MISQTKPAENEKLNINLLGGSTVHYRNNTLRMGKKQCALIAYLALSTDGMAARDRLVSILWSDSQSSKGKSNLRQMLKNIRDSLANAGFPGLRTTDPTRVRLPPDSILLDLRRILNSTTEQSLAPALLETRSIHEELMSDLEGIDAEFDNWIYTQRRLFRENLSRSLENRLSRAEDPEIRNTAIALRNVDPSNEVAVRALMHLYASEKNTAGALRVYATLVDILDEEFGMEPTDETEMLAVKIKMAEPESAYTDDAGVHLQPGADSDTLPDLLIENFNTDLLPQELVYIANGFRQDLVASLVRFRDWRVIEKSLRKTTYLQTDHANRQYILRAQTYLDGEDFFLVFTVIDTNKGIVIWSYKTLLKMESWFQTQTLLVRKIATTLNIHISANRLSEITRKRALPAALHDRWLLGQNQLFLWSPESSNKAEELFKSLIVDAPHFAPAYSGLVQIENSRHLIFPGYKRKATNDDSTIKLAREAINIDPVDSKAHLSMAWSYCLCGRFDEALRYVETAVNLNENDPWTLVSSSLGFAFCAEYDSARSIITVVDSLDIPLNRLHFAYQVGTRFLCKDYQGAVIAAENACDVISNIPGWASAAYTHLGQHQRAKQSGLHFLSLVRTRWHGSGAGSESDIIDWFLQGFPIRSRTDWHRLKTGITGAGLAVSDTAGPPH